MPQLDPTWFASQLFWLVLTFGVLYAALSRAILPPLLAIMEKREQTVTGSVERARQLRAEAEAAREHYERSLAESRAAAQTLLAESAAAAKHEAEKAHAAADRAIAAKLSEAERAIAQSKQELLAKLNPASAELASLIVEKLVHHKPNAETVSKAISQLSGRKAA